MNFPEWSEDQRRQYIDSQALMRAMLDAQKRLAQTRGSMFWRELRGTPTLIRTNTLGGQKSLGARSAQTQAMYDKFIQTKTEAQARVKSLQMRLDQQRKLNKLYGVGRTPGIAVRTLQALHKAGVSPQFMVVGTHALYAYESACGVQVGSEAMATRDIDLLFDTRQRIKFASALSRIDSSLIGVLQKVDATFRVLPDRLQTAVNADGFEVDVIRRMATGGDPQPLHMSEHEDDLWAVQVPSGSHMVDARKFEQLVVSPLGEMAMMRTLHPLDFVRVKQQLATRPTRDPLKRTKDALQAQVVQRLWDEFLQHRVTGDDGN